MFKFNVILPDSWEMVVKEVAYGEGESLVGHVRGLIRDDLKERGVFEKCQQQEEEMEV